GSPGGRGGRGRRRRERGVIDRGRHDVLGVLVDAVDYDRAVATVMEAARERRPLAMTAAASHVVMTGVQDPEHRHRLNALDMIVPDGQPVRWALNLLHGTALAERVYGPELMLRLCGAAAREGLPVYFYGSNPPVLEPLRARLLARFPELRIAGMRAGRFRRLTPDEHSALVAEIRDSGAAVVFVGLGCPRQEVFVYENRERIGVPLVAVGAAFDFHAGLVPQAPPAMQRNGLEWLFRLAHEPRRLWRRYLGLGPAYLWLVALQLTGARRLDPAGAPAPREELGYG
ncbi:MAG TPA: WecB/TagA/CpsF family glycosyltransferase, partial [Gemmatimonadales bacterium]